MTYICDILSALREKTWFEKGFKRSARERIRVIKSTGCRKAFVMSYTYSRFDQQGILSIRLSSPID